MQAINSTASGATVAEEEGELPVLQAIIALDPSLGDAGCLAARSLQLCGNLYRVLRADARELAQTGAPGGPLAAHFRRFLRLSAAAARSEICRRSVLDATDRVVEYCRLHIEDTRREQLLGLYLDSNFRLIGERRLQCGTVNHVTVYPREVLRPALILQATNIVLVHNHPGGNCTPSRGDIAMTREVASVSERLGIALADHLILGDSDYFSFRQSGKLGPCRRGPERVPTTPGTRR